MSLHEDNHSPPLAMTGEAILPEFRLSPPRPPPALLHSRQQVVSGRVAALCSIYLWLAADGGEGVVAHVWRPVAQLHAPPTKSLPQARGHDSGSLSSVSQVPCLQHQHQHPAPRLDSQLLRTATWQQ